MKKILLILGLIFLTLSCMGPGKFILDNPTDKEINIKLDGKEYRLGSQEHETIPLKAGEHSMILENGKEVKFIVYASSKGGIINPTRSDYIFVSIAYVVEGKGGITPMERIINIEEIEYQGPYEKVNDLIIDKNIKDWTYEIYKPFPDEIRLSNSKSNGAIKTKVFSKREFIDFIETETGTVGFHDQNKVVTEPVEPEKIVLSSVTAPNFKNKEEKKYADEIAVLDKAYLSATTAKEQKKIRSDFRKAWKNYVQSMIKSEYDEEEYKLRAEFSPQNLNKGILILSEE